MRLVALLVPFLCPATVSAERKTNADRTADVHAIAIMRTVP